MGQIKIYTDGAYSSSRNNGGWAFVVLENDQKIHTNFGPEPDTTNNRMEIRAIMNGCSWAIENKYTEVDVYTDSMYVIGTMTSNWKRNKNNDLWEVFDYIASLIKINWHHVKGHAGDKYNNLCDALASQASHIITK